MKISHRGGHIDLLSPVDLLSSKTGEILLKQVPLKLDKFHTNDALWFLRDSLDVLKGELSGKLKINFKGSDIEFLPQKGFALEKLELVDSDNPLEKILVNNGISFQRGKMTLKNGEDFELDVDVRMKKTNFIAKGLIRPERLDLEVKEGFIDLEEFGPISGTMLKGSGRLTSKIYGTYENVIFDFFPDLSDFSVVDLNLGRVRGQVSLHLRELDLFLRDIKANYKSTEYTGQGWLNFDKKSGLDLDINIHKGFYTDTLEILSDLVSELSFKLPKAALEYSADVKVSGPFDEDKLVVEGALKGKELNFFLEDFSSISTNFKYFSTGFKLGKYNFN